MSYKSDIEIARGATLKPIEEIGAGLGIPDKALYRYGPMSASCRSTMSPGWPTARTAS